VEKGLVISTFGTLDSIGINIPQSKESPIEIIYSEDFPFSAYDFLMKPGRSGKSIIIFKLKWKGYTPDVILHEIGHAVYDYFIDENLPLELQRWEGIYSAYSEAMAEVLSFFIMDKDWLGKFFIIKDKVDGKEITRLLNGEEITQFSNAMKVKLMVNLLSWMGNYEFEREIYNDPDQDYEELFTRIKKELKRDDFPIRFSWSSMLSFFASSDESIYYQNYILSYIIAAQVQNRIKERFGKIFGSKEIGEFLINKLYKFGMSHPWEEVVEEATGKKLSAKDLIDLIISNLYQD
jgi:peptidyl-dipeptidase A